MPKGVFRPRPGRRDRRGTRPYAKHGLTPLKRAVRALGGRTLDALDKRQGVGRALAQWRRELIADLGGPEAVSTQEAAVVDLCVRLKLMLDSIDAWIMRQPSLIHGRRRALLPVVRERQALANALVQHLSALGLRRRSRPVPSLSEYLAEKYHEAKGDGGEGETTEGDDVAPGGGAPSEGTSR